ncbi:DUF4276 family protein [Chitinimonas lacunae]|uniref:DUF4276 family protein n=1 Tax=Chitinimonas lacunae TaxID=1963018 RepID=A0ABV8MQN5_9NEIS
MRELVFLLEEPSARAMLESLLPRILSEEINFRLIAFEGKQDLEKQITRKIRSYLNHHARFIVLRDQDSHPQCQKLKQNLLDLCHASGKGTHCMVRIACRELETFYLADLQAVEQGLKIRDLASKQSSSKFRSPDYLGSPSHELKTLTKQRYEKVSGSREIGKYLKLENHRSPSFRNLIAAIYRLQRDLLAIDL